MRSARRHELHAIGVDHPHADLHALAHALGDDAELLELRQHELDRRVAAHLGAQGRTGRARDVLEQDGDDAPQRDAEREDDAGDGGVTVWHVADRESEWFRPSDSSFMINYRVDDLDALIAELRTAGIEIVGDPQSDENGKFAWIMDPDGNKVELWEPMRRDAKSERETP